MRAVTYDRYGPPEVLRLTELPRPDPASGEVLVEVAASTVTTADWRLRASDFPRITWLPGRLMFGLFRPRKRVLGGEFSGRVAAVGAGVTRFAVGDPVFGFSGHGAHAEYLTIDAEGPIAHRPQGVSDAEAASVPFGAMTALVFLRDVARVAPGQRVLVLGASGGVGSHAVQIAKWLGAEAVAVAGSGRGALLADLGADRVVDYSAEDWRQAGPVDVILDTAGISHFAEARAALAPRGLYVPLEFGAREIWQAVRTRKSRGQHVAISVSGETRADMELLAGMLANATLRPVVDGVWPLERIAEAHVRVESRHKIGSAVIRIAPEAAQSTAV